ncbi:MAG: hypothetical protein HRF46_13005 [Acidobacteriota bacterium]|jgi:hypothetical protein
MLVHPLGFDEQTPWFVAHVLTQLPFSSQTLPVPQGVLDCRLVYVHCPVWGLHESVVQGLLSSHSTYVVLQ